MISNIYPYILPETACIFWDIFCSTIIFVVYLSMSKLLIEKCSYHKSLWLLSCSLNGSFSEWSGYFVPLWMESFPWQSRKGKYSALRRYAKFHQLNQTHWNVVTYSFPGFPYLFEQYLPKWSTLRYLKADEFDLSQKVRTVLVWYLLLGIRILVYPCTECGTSIIHFCLEDNTSSFSWMSLKSETTEARP